MFVTGEFRYLQRRLQLCSLKCNDRINRENREQIFSSYYELETTEAQNVYLFSSLTTTTPKCSLVNAKQHREVSVSYTVNVAGQKVQVCKKAFLRLHAISQSKVDFIVNQCKAGLVTARPSFRGKHNNRPNRIRLVTNGVRKSTSIFSPFPLTAHITVEQKITLESTCHQYCR